jgi:hypothetical protein
MSDLRPISHWGLWMRLNEPVGLSLREQLAVHFWANWEMLRQFRDLAVSTVVALVPTGAFALLLWGFRPLRRGGLLDASRADLGSIILIVATAIVAWLAVQHLFFVYAMQRWYAPFVRREIARRGIPMCERCGHRLPPQAPATCPECGVPLQGPQDSKAVSG